MTNDDELLTTARARMANDNGVRPGLEDFLSSGLTAIRAEHVAPDRETLIAWLHARWKFEYDECPHGTYSGGAQNGKPYAMCERWAVALLASGVLGVNADTIRAKAWDEGANAYETAVTFRDESLPLTNPYQKEAGA